jgi:hypothetical protein
MDSGFRRNDGFWTFDEFIKYRFNKKEKKLAFGSYPEISLQDARKNVKKLGGYWPTMLILMLFVKPRSKQ